MTTTSATPQPTPIPELVDLANRTAIVTGGAMGIGLAIARRLHEAGASVVIADLDLIAGEHATGALGARRADSALAVRSDVSDPESVEQMVRVAVRSRRLHGRCAVARRIGCNDG
jgi:NAD(P)-dependent dehydrogenase (short-subunit alcohol dehydrogenase family)